MLSHGFGILCFIVLYSAYAEYCGIESEQSVFRTELLNFVRLNASISLRRPIRLRWFLRRWKEETLSFPTLPKSSKMYTYEQSYGSILVGHCSVRNTFAPCGIGIPQKGYQKKQVGLKGHFL